MIKKGFTLLLLIILSGLYSVQALAGQLDNIRSWSMPTGDMAVIQPSKPMELLSSADAENLDRLMSGYTPEDKSYLINNAPSYYYYEHIDPMAKEIYDIIYGVAQDPVNEGNIGFMMTDVDPSGEEFYYEFNLAFRALCFDHPELFWLYSGEEASVCFSSEAVNMGGFYFVYIMMYEPFHRFAEQMSAFNEAAEAFLTDIDTDRSQYDIIRQVHDKLIDLVNYNDPVAESMSFIYSGGQDLAHTAYGALVADSSGNPNYAVCDGYTLAFEYLLQQCGIEAVFIGGEAGPSELEAGGHAWNMVRLDGVWYEVDATWDDSGSMIDDLSPLDETTDYYLEALNDVIYRDKIDHYMFLVSTERIRHFVPGEEYDYITNDQQYVLSLVGESVHIRYEDEGSLDEYDPAVIGLAPEAMASF